MIFFRKQFRSLVFGCFILCAAEVSAQGRNINKLTLETTYSYSEIHASLRDLVDKHTRENYFKDDFFNGMLAKILLDKQFTSKEKVQLFYLMQKKLGYAFVGVNYLPPKQNYFIFHLTKVQVLKTTQEALGKYGINGAIYLQIADSHQTNDPVIASNALLIASLLKVPQAVTRLRHYTKSSTVLQSKNPAIFNHYVCLSASLLPDTVITANLKENLKSFKEEAMIEDALCAMYSNPCPLAPIKKYVLQEKNPENDLAIQTAVCVLQYKVAEASYKSSLQNFVKESAEPWKKELLKKLLGGQIPFNYSLTKQDQLIPKSWNYVKTSIYNDGVLISNNTLLEFDAN